MKAIIFIFLFLCVNIFSQTNPGWNTLDTTIIPVHSTSGERIELFANHYGVHLLKIGYVGTQRDVRYYRLKTTGDLDSGFTTSGMKLDDSSDFPNITGDENILYAVYKRSNKIKVKLSTNGGSNWSTDSLLFQNGNVLCNGVDAAYTSTRGLHVVWSEKVGNKYESYFDRFIDNDWIGTVTITNTSPIDSGGFPSVTTSSVSGVERTHISINTGGSDIINGNVGKSYSRDFNYSSWSSPVAIVSSLYSRVEKLIVTDDTIHCFYYTTEGTPKLKYKRKGVIGTVWSDSSEISNSTAGPSELHEVNITKTTGDTLHVIFYSGAGGILHRKKYNTYSSWSTPFEVEGGVSQEGFAITSISNDLFVMTTKADLNYRYRQYDSYPLKPTNLTVTKSSNLHPLLQWNRNNEPDVASYKIYKYVSQDQGWYYLTTTTSPSYEDLTESYCPPGQECIGGRTVTYKVTAVDLHPYESLASDSVITAVRGGVPQKYSGDNQELPDNYSLGQNFPNPFNPSTQITYALAEDAKVQIKVYDMLGTEVAELINETKPAGFYETTFDASDLSSGVYIYRITALNGDRIVFSQSKQMIFLK